MDTLINDLRYSLRILKKRPVFALIAVITLGLGIGANAAMFSIVHTVLIRPLPFYEPDRLIYMDETNPAQGYDEYSVSYPNFVEWQKQNRSFESLTGWSFAGMTLTGAGEPSRVLAAYVSADFFSVLRVTPSMGRPFGPDADRVETESAVVISHSFWQRHLNGTASPLGLPVTLNGQSFTVIGVTPPDFRFPNDRVQVWLPLGLLISAPEIQNRSVHVLRGLGRLKPAVTLDQARTEMEAIMGRIAGAYPGEDVGHSVLVRTLHEQIVGDVKPALLILFGAVAFVLLIACANVANLLLAHAANRQKEMAVRAALGAGRARVARQLLTESVILAIAGGAAGLVLALWSVDLLRVMLSNIVPRADGIRIDETVLLFTLTLSVATGLLFGLFPAFQSSRPDLHIVLKDRGAVSGEKRRFRQGLIVAEIALSLVLLAGAGLLLKSFRNVFAEESGFRADHLLLMSVSLPNTDYPETGQVIEYYRQLPDRLEGLPGIASASAVNEPPITGGDSNGMLTIEGRSFPPGQEPGASFRRVLPNYFRTMGIPLVQGRAFDERDTGVKERKTIVSALIARRYFPNESPIGKRIKIGPPEGEPWMEIIGVAGDVRNTGLDAEPALATYEAHAQRPWRSMNLIIRTEVEPSGLVEPVRRALRAAAPNLLISDVGTMDERIAGSVAPRRLQLILLALFAGIALILALVGIYGVMAYTVSRRTQEIGIRMALGAQHGDVLKLIVGEAMTLSFIGIAIGLSVAFLLMRLITDLLYKVSPFDPLTFFGISAILLVVAGLASFIPARRATKVDPIVALRFE